MKLEGWPFESLTKGRGIEGSGEGVPPTPTPG